jgi:phage baseplate assembly protein W
MTDLAHDFGADLSFSPTGDLTLATGADAGRQRVLRRLLTNPGDDIWNLDYGAGLATFVGQPASGLRIEAVVRAQVFREAAVARSPELVIQTAEIGPSALRLDLRYADATTPASPITLSISVGGA